MRCTTNRRMDGGRRRRNSTMVRLRGPNANAPKACASKVPAWWKARRRRQGPDDGAVGAVPG
jgi:hypothetical protein